MQVRCIDASNSTELTSNCVYTVVEHENDDYPEYCLAEVRFSHRKNRFVIEPTFTSLNIKKDTTNPKDLLGAKKPRLSLVPPSGLVYAALAMSNGAEKYGPYNWRDKKVKVMIYLEACMRHILSYQDGEENAQDSGAPHLGHAIACLLIIIDALETGNLIDNRPKPGAMSKLIEKYTKGNK